MTLTYKDGNSTVILHGFKGSSERLKRMTRIVDKYAQLWALWPELSLEELFLMVGLAPDGKLEGMLDRAIESKLRTDPDVPVQIFCECAGEICPQGKIGSQTRCRIWIKRKHLSEAGRDEAARMSRFDR